MGCIIKNYKFSLIAKLDQECHVKVKTPCGITDSFKLNEIIVQGSVFGSLKCSVQVDSLGRDSLCDEDGIGIFTYKGHISVPPLSLVDDVLTVSSCGIKTSEVNTMVNAKIESKQLTLGGDKCFKLHIGKNKSKQKTCKTSDNLKVHSDKMRSADKIKYLGNIINSEGSLNDTLTERTNKAIGLRSQLKSLISNLV